VLRYITSYNGLYNGFFKTLGETQRVPSQRYGPEARHPEYSEKEHQEARTKLGGAIHSSRQRGKGHTHWMTKTGRRLTSNEIIFI